MSKHETKSKTEKGFRAPIVTIMGHVDHGKTSILDVIRKTNVQAREFGGITQHIGAYQILHKNNPITFIDTPGHAAFSQMRSRGGKAADIVVLVVAADDGVMPQTKEAISHAHAANVPIIVAINKVDVPGADVQKVKQMLAQENVLVEDWGGNIVCVEVSAKTRKNINLLLDSILVQAEILELNSQPHSDLEALIIEARLDKKKGAVASAIVKTGTLKTGMEIYAGKTSAKVRSLTNDKGEIVKEALPSTPVEILGFKNVPNVGDLIVEKGSGLEELSASMDRMEIVGKSTKKVVGIIIKADTQGTLEAIKASLAEIVTTSAAATFSLKFVLCATGDVSDSDVLLASTTGSVIVGFNVGAGASVKELAEIKHVPFRTYRTIYELVEEVSDMLEGAAFNEESKVKGRAKVLKTFKLPSGDVVIGCIVIAGALKKDKRVAIYSKDPSDLTSHDTPIYTGSIKTLKIKKDEVPLVGKDNECGVFLKPQFEQAIEGNFIEVL